MSPQEAQEPNLAHFTNITLLRRNNFVALEMMARYDHPKRERIFRTLTEASKGGVREAAVRALKLPGWRFC